MEVELDYIESDSVSVEVGGSVMARRSSDKSMRVMLQGKVGSLVLQDAARTGCIASSCCLSYLGCLSKEAVRSQADSQLVTMLYQRLVIGCCEAVRCESVC